jgi:hypothetical protein
VSDAAGVAAQRLAVCPGCGGTRINAHSWYARWAVEPECDTRIAVRRLKCMSCKRTISLLPCFLHRHRHYTLATQAAVITARVQEGQPWSRAGPQEGPSQRTRRRWVTAFLAGAPLWLVALLRLLAAVRPSAAVLDAHNQQADLFTCMQAAADWLARGHDVWQTVWRWGWNAGVGRLT